MNLNSRQNLPELIEINLDDMVNSAGLKHSRLLQPIVRRMLRSLARQFALQVLDFDDAVAVNGLAVGSRGILNQLTDQVCVEGVEHIPTSGPLLILSNHPGLTDTVALFSAIPRSDLRVLSASRPFLAALKATSSYLISIDQEAEQRFDVLRATAGHLRQGGTILTFPAGKIEPDPTVLPGAVESLDHWNASMGLFARMVPDLTIVPVIVSGVLARQAVFHPFTRIRRKQADRESFGASLQLIMKQLRPRAWPVKVYVRFAPPICASSLTHLREPEVISQAIKRTVKPFLANIGQSGRWPIS
jgi:1-acyl-sn-glycerol-3-phosphate acyltransferase